MKTFKEQQELDEAIKARRGRPRIHDRSKDLGDPQPEPDQHIIMQLRNAEDVNGNKAIDFEEGPSKKVPIEAIRKVIKAYEGIKPAQKDKLQAIIQKSYNDLMKVAKAIR